MLFREIISVYSENHAKPINSLWVNAELLTGKAGSGIVTTRLEGVTFVLISE
jgi:hypothetical protein